MCVHVCPRRLLSFVFAFACVCVSACVCKEFRHCTSNFRINIGLTYTVSYFSRKKKKKGQPPHSLLVDAVLFVCVLADSSLWWGFAVEHHRSFTTTALFCCRADRHTQRHFWKGMWSHHQRRRVGIQSDPQRSNRSTTTLAHSQANTSRCR